LPAAVKRGIFMSTKDKTKKKSKGKIALIVLGSFVGIIVFALLI